MKIEIELTSIYGHSFVVSRQHRKHTRQLTIFSLAVTQNFL